ncbi:MAG: beta-glucuronidase [Prevotella sp.]|nr:beta-glucuronidase [Prevotella sp.]
MKKQMLLVGVMMLSLAMQAEEMPLLGNVMGRQGMSLNGKWNYIVDVQEEGFYDYRMNENRWGFFINAKPQRPEDLIEYDFDKSPTINVPGDWNTQDDRLFFYEGCVWMKKDFNYTRKSGHRAILYFGAVNYDAVVYVNGKKVGHHEGGFTPFNFDVTDVLVDGSNFVIVKIDNKRKAESVPTLIFDWWNYGGITRDVTLLDVPNVFIENYSLQLLSLEGRRIGFSVKLNTAEAGREVRLSIPELKIKKNIVTDAEGKAVLFMKAKPQLWSPDNPKLYDVSIVMDGDTICDKIGFRKIETRGKQILLNGEPVFLRGISIHEEKAFGGGRANGKEDAQLLLSWAKDLGCNFVRLAHYPHNEWMVREAERMGIMVWSEIPCYWTVAWDNPATLENARRQLRDMIERDINRANVIIWSIANETPHSSARDIFLTKQAQYAHQLDSTRLISMAMEVTGASNYVNRLNDNMNKYVDVVSFNQYVGWYRDVHDAPKMKWEIPYDKPVIISEFGGGAKQGYKGAKNQRWTEDFQANLYEENLKMIDKIEGLAGTSPWILKDFRSPRRVLPEIQDYYNRKGLVGDNGKRKMAFDVLKAWYTTKAEAYSKKKP